MLSVQEGEKTLQEVWCERIDSGQSELTVIIDEIAEECNIPKPVAKIAVARGCRNSMEAMAYLEPNVEDFNNPWDLPDMRQAVDRILSAKENNEKVCIYGDYDVDGTTAVSILVDYLKSLEMTVIYKIPNRLIEGYGMNINAINKLADQGVKLIVTVDNGIAAKDEVAYAAEKGIDVIVTDHHECQGELPKAVAVVDAKRDDSQYPFSELCGAGIAFKCVQALEEAQNQTRDLRNYLECAAIATVADIVPLQNENRLIVKMGIESINADCKNLGIQALAQVSNVQEVTSGNIGFVLAPKINAAGRLGEADCVVDLYTKNNIAQVEQVATFLKNENEKRQEIEGQIYEEAIQAIKKDKRYREVFICASGQNWHSGVIGIVASKIQEIWYHPVIVMGIDEDGMARGSCRSVEGINIFEALSNCSELFETYGGHEMAAGFSIKKENIPKLELSLKKWAKENHARSKLVKKVYYDGSLSEDDIDWELMDCISMCEPYGVKNPSPLFRLSHVHPEEVKTMGKEQAHLSFKDGDLRCIAFSKGKLASSLLRDYEAGIDILAVPKINHFMGNDQIELMIKNIQIPELFDHKKCWHFLKVIKNGSDEMIKELPLWHHDSRDVLPNREETVWVYIMLKKYAANGVKFDSLIDQNKHLNCFKLLAILEIFNEIDVVHSKLKKGVIYSKIPAEQQKKDIKKAELVIKLKRNIL